MINLTGGADFPTVAADDPLHGGQPDAAARELRLGVQTLEGAEKLVGVTHVESGAIVAHNALHLSPGNRMT